MDRKDLENQLAESLSVIAAMRGPFKSVPPAIWRLKQQVAQLRLAAVKARPSFSRLPLQPRHFDQSRLGLRPNPSRCNYD